jgi:hypothetical protein
METFTFAFFEFSRVDVDRSFFGLRPSCPSARLPRFPRALRLHGVHQLFASSTVISFAHHVEDLLPVHSLLSLLSLLISISFRPAGRRLVHGDLPVFQQVEDLIGYIFLRFFSSSSRTASEQFVQKPFTVG